MKSKAEYFNQFMQYQVTIVSILNNWFSEAELLEIIGRHGSTIRSAYDLGVPYESITEEIKEYENNLIY